MTESTTPYLEMLRQMRIGLIDCESTEGALAHALHLAQASFARLDAREVSPSDKILERYHALIVGVGDTPGHTAWSRPESLRDRCSVPLLLAGEWAAISTRLSLLEHCDDVFLASFSEKELMLRLCRLTSGKPQRRRVVTGPAKPCVVVADDDRDIIIYLKTVLGNLAVDAHFVSDGKAALTTARKLLPDLLVLDVKMPLMDGIEVLRCLKNDPGTCGLRTVLLTASTDSADVSNSAGLGAAEYILKPFGHMDLIRKLKRFLRDSVP